MAKTKRRAVREPLSCERIELAALELIEEEGYDGFSMRKLAAKLGCEAMSIYHYFPSMAHLTDALLNRVVAATPLPPRDLPWAERLRRVAYEYRAAALRNPRFFQVAILHRMNTPTGMHFIDEAITIFRDAGFDPEARARLFRAFGYYISGAALDEAAGYARGISAVDPVPNDVAARDYPEITAAGPYFQRQHHEATFALGLEIMIDGIAARAPKVAAKKLRRAKGKQGGGVKPGQAG